MAEERDFNAGFSKIVVRLSPLVFFIGLALAEAVGDVGDERPYEVGSKAIVFDAHANSVLMRGERVRVLTPDLENGRGLVAVDCASVPAGRPPCLPIEHLVRDSHIVKAIQDRQCDTQLLAVDAWEGVSALCVERNAIPKPHRFTRLWQRFSDAVSDHGNSRDRLRSVTLGTLLPISRRNCPDEECLDVEHGGLAIDQSGDIVLAEPHKDRVATFRLSELGLLAGTVRPVEDRLRAPEPASEVLYTGQASGLVHDVALMPDGRLLIAESSVDPTRSGVRLLAKGRTPVDLIPGSYAPHPIGVFFSRGSGRVYATDVLNGRQRWMYVEQSETGWSAPKVFWSAEDRSTGTFALRHLTTAWNESAETVFAGGPDGLYIISPAGLLLAKYSLGRPVNGMDWGRRRELFFTSGRYVGVLRLADTLQLDRDVAARLPRISASADSPTVTPAQQPASVEKDAKPKSSEAPKIPKPTVKRPPKPTSAPKCACGKGPN